MPQRCLILKPAKNILFTDSSYRCTRKRCNRCTITTFMSGHVILRLITSIKRRRRRTRIRARPLFWSARDRLADDHVTVELRQRLHLGKTITETPPGEYKHYQSNHYSRIQSGQLFHSDHLTRTMLSLTCLEDLVLILYETPYQQ
jgi:hypothetical protein